MSDLLARPLVPVANEDDAVATYESLREYLVDDDGTPLVVNVIEKAGGAPDKAGVEQRQKAAEAAFEAFRERAAADDLTVKTEIIYGTDVADAIIDHARDVDASAIAFHSRGGGALLNVLSGSVRTKLVTESDRPVIVLPNK
ncbi:universal stress protein [Haloparvum sp. PAK95]|uniref:universal stress protein n=1 Tax=Haloparvum sp. PAK95 TaxID=3418962 RepID=UPI003D2EAA3E